MKPVMKNIEASTCKRCYTCVRVCPSKAIRVSHGKARIDLKRCIHCGNCIRVCPAGQWEYRRDQALVRGLINSDKPVAVVLDTAFPAAFPGMDHRILVGQLRQLGFDVVTDASFAADMVASRQRTELPEPRQDILLSAWCPACVDMIRKFDPEHIPLLSHTLPPASTMAKVLKQLHGDDIHIVYVSPCIAHKTLVDDEQMVTGIDAVLTFHELDEMMRGLDEEPVTPSDFDPPHGWNGVYSALPLGVAMTGGYPCNPLDTIVTDGSGPRRAVRILDNIVSGDINHGFVDLLFCRGCVDGCGMPEPTDNRYKRRNAILKFAKKRLEDFDQKAWDILMEQFHDLDLSSTIQPLPCRLAAPDKETIDLIRKNLDQYGIHQNLDCYACGYATCTDFVAAVGKGLAETDMCIQYQLRKLHATIHDLETSHERMNNILDVMHHSEKLANLAQLSAATAYKLNNPLSVVLLYSHLLKEEYKDHTSLNEDLKIIVDQVEKVKDIFITLLNLSSRNKILLESVDILELIDRTLMLVQPAETMTINVTTDVETAYAEMDRGQIGYVLTNLVENAIESMGPEGVLTIHTTGDESSLTIRVTDNGSGIRKSHLAKIWDPFFTTKRVSVGAGLGLAVVKEIIRQHQGTINVISNDNATRGPTGTTFTISLPRHGTYGMHGGIS